MTIAELEPATTRAITLNTRTTMKALVYHGPGALVRFEQEGTGVSVTRLETRQEEAHSRWFSRMAGRGRVSFALITDLCHDGPLHRYEMSANGLKSKKPWAA
jgi:hypothetical protein